jgi:hypothetical protein
MSEVETQEDKGPEVFHIANKAQAAWAMEKLADVTKRQFENQLVAVTRTEEIKMSIQERLENVAEWLEDENGKLQRDVDFFTGKLIEWHMSLIEADPDDEAEWKKQKDKTVKLPDGELKVRVGSYSTNIVDEDAFLAWWHEQPPELQSEVGKAVVSAKKDALGQYIAQTGESIPGITYERGRTTFTVKPKVGE